ESLDTQELGQALHQLLLCWLIVSCWMPGLWLCGRRTVRDRQSGAWNPITPASLDPSTLALGHWLSGVRELGLMHIVTLPVVVIPWSLGGVSDAELGLGLMLVAVNVAAVAAVAACL